MVGLGGLEDCSDDISGNENLFVSERNITGADFPWIGTDDWNWRIL